MYCSKQRYKNALIALVVLFQSVLFFGCGHQADRKGVSNQSNCPQFTIGWQIAWAPAGEIAQTLIHTDIAERQGLKLKFQGFLFGPEMNEAALGRQLNCLNTGSIPTISLMSRSDNWRIIGRLILQPLAIVAKAGSNIKSIDDLKGKSIGVPFGGGPHPYLLDLLKTHHIEIGESASCVKLVNVMPSEQVAALKQGIVEAIATWEPQTCVAVSKKIGTIIYQDENLGFIVINKDMLKNNRQSVEALLKAYIEANYFVATHRSEADQWFSEASGIDPELLKSVTIIEPNLSAKRLADISLDISQNKLDRLQKICDTMLANGLIKKPVHLDDFIDLTCLHKAANQ